MSAPRKLSVPIAYVDEMNAIDNRAQALVELCRGCCDPERLSPFVVEQLGNLFHDLLARRHVVEHFFLGTDLDPQRTEEARAKGEMRYLAARYSPRGVE